MKIQYKLMIALSLFIVFSTIPALLLYFLGYKDHNVWNDNSAETNCLIKNYIISSGICTYQCYCGPPLSKIINLRLNIPGCQKCDFVCFSGSILIKYLKHFETTIKLYEQQENLVNLTDLLKKYYPINTTINCYYNINNKTDVRLVRDDMLIYQIPSGLLLSIGVITLTIWSIREIVIYCKNKQYYDFISEY